MPSEPQMIVSVIVPTRNSRRTIEGCLQSLRDQTHSCAIVVVDNSSSDGTADIARHLADVVIVAGPERSAQRNIGARATDATVLGFIDSDMYVGATVVADAVAHIEAGAHGVVVPERTIGDGYWSSVRAFERSFYENHATVEAARFYRTEIFAALGGFDESLTGPEDWDLTVRARRLGAIGRAEGWIDHDEGHVHFVDACRKKAYYAEGLRRYGRKHGMGGLLDAGRRPYFRHPHRLVDRRGPGLVALKVGEATAVSVALLRAGSGSDGLRTSTR
jgi:arabinofuranan 3-O-arabinosyltransferase